MTIPPASAQQPTREQCRVGDYVPVEFVQEWRDETAPQEFRAPSFDLSPVISGFGGSVPTGDTERWRFERKEAGWVRVA